MNIKTLKPNCSSVALAESSNCPGDWLLHSTGILYTFDANKALVTSIVETSSELSSKDAPVEAISPLESKSRKEIDEETLEENAPEVTDSAAVNKTIQELEDKKNESIKANV